MPLALLGLLRPLPLFVIGLRYGALVSLLAGTLAALAIHLIFPFPNGILIFLTICFPAFCMVHLTHKGMMVQKMLPNVQIDVIGFVMFFTALFVICTSVFLFIFFFGFDFDAFNGLVKTTFAKSLESLQGVLKDEASLKVVTKYFIENASTLLPTITVFIWSLVTMLNYFAAIKLLPKLGFQALAIQFHSIRLPFAALILITLGFFLTYFDGLTGLLGSIIVASLFAPLVIQGMAIVHVKTLGKAWRKGFLSFFYLTTFMFGWTIFIPFFIGLTDPAFNFRKSKPH
jgi:hypothetical protein